jgi:hypothetical protein
VLTPTTPDRGGSAHTGDLVQVQLPITQRWSFTNGQGPLMLLQPAGYEDGRANVCVWNFRASALGTSTLLFSGTAICESNVPCPQYVLAEKYTVQVL